MTGAPAEVWRKFRFRTVPGWAYAFLALLVTGIGLLPIFIIMAVVSRRASGHLPLTRASRQKLRLVEWSIISLLPLMIVLFIGAAIVGSGSNSETASTITFILIVLATLSFLGGPRGNVMEQRPGYHDKLVELRNVHPAFVVEVNYKHQQRAAQQAASYSPPGLPQTPGST